MSSLDVALREYKERIGHDATRIPIVKSSLLNALRQAAEQFERGDKHEAREIVDNVGNVVEFLLELFDHQLEIEQVRTAEMITLRDRLREYEPMLFDQPTKLDILVVIGQPGLGMS